ncbi:MAG: M1 family metallopeptidase [Actinomycetota bacterium]|nr:M1 family metallopeptidase [Actinomycetota bacterium]
MPTRARAAAVLAAGAMLLAACADDAPAKQANVEPTIGASQTSTLPTDREPDPAADLDVALSEPREDSYYPEVGDPGVDALHYDLALAWDPGTLVLSATERLTFRATETAGEFQLDFGEPLEVEELTVDGEAADYKKVGKDLVVAHGVQADRRYRLELTYSGLPQPVEVPVQRPDFDTTGWTVTRDGETWTMQEPFGAYSWYAVNDHPADKALYDFTLSVPTPWTGVANGELLEVSDDDGTRTTTWHLAEPAASYLVTTAFGDFDMTRDRSSSGVPITYWTPRSEPRIVDALDVTPEAMAWLEEMLGPYPFDTFGTVVVDSESGMETQTMVTLGNTRYTLSSEVIVHELAHQWYGDQVTPDDWRDVWMNEGMAMYLQGMWEAERERIPVAEKMDEWALDEALFRAEAGPPAAYSPDFFGNSTVYYGPALMYQELREMVGDAKFFRMVRGWPAANDNENAGREEFLAFMEKSTGEELSAFFDDWLLGEETPPRD